ncbi:MAG TPA: hypothetical protein VFW48_09265 [Solirubrobacterales bacterium]|nr:hypothetical protein [Solirubrobacterales bacterium]
MASKPSDAMERLENLVHTYDADLEFATCTGAAWSGELRLTLTNPEGAPSRSMVFYKAGAGYPEEAAEALLADAESWIAEGGEPMPPPPWLLGEGES